MAKKKKKIYEENKKFAPGGSAVSEWEENQRNTFTMGRTISNTGKRYNTGLDEEYYEPVKNETYKTYVASKLSQAYNPKNRLNITAKDLSSYSNARKKLILANPKADLMRQGEFTSQYKANVDKKYRLADLIDRANQLNYQDISDTVRKSYNDVDAIKQLGNARNLAEGLQKDAKDYISKYGDSKELQTILKRAKLTTDYINQNAKGGSAISNKVFEKAVEPTLEGKMNVEDKYKVIELSNMQDKFGNLSYDEIRNVKPKTPAEKEYINARKWELGTKKDLKQEYADTNEEIYKLQQERDSLTDEKEMPLNQGVGTNAEKNKARIKEIDNRLKELSEFRNQYRAQIEVPENMKALEKKSSKELADIIGKGELYEDDERAYLQSVLANRKDAKETYDYITDKLRNDYEKRTYEYNDPYNQKETDREQYTKYRELQLQLANKIAGDLADKIENDLFVNEDEDKTRAKFKKELSKYDKDLANDIFDVAKRKANQENAEIEEVRAEERGEESPILTMPEGALKRNIGGVGAYASGLSRQFEFNTDRSKLDPVDFYDDNYARLREGQALQQGGMKSAKGWSSLYQAINSGADMGLAAIESAPLLLVPGVGKTLFTNTLTAIMGTEAGAQSMLEAHEQGYSDQDAMQYGIVSGIDEILGEKASIDIWLSKFAGNGRSLKNFVKGLATSGIAEGSEEVATDLINRTYDNMVNNDNSMYNRQIRELMKQGLTKSAATEKVDSEFIDQLKEGATVGLLAGLLFGGSVGGVNYAARSIAENKANNDIGNIITNNVEDEDIDYMINEGLKRPEESESFIKAENLQQKLNEGKSLSNREIGGLSRSLILEENPNVEVEDDYRLETLKDIASENNMSKSANEQMVKAYRNNVVQDGLEVNPRLFANTYKMFYTLGQDPNYNSIGDVFKNMPEYVDYANQITPDAAGKAFSAGNNSVQQIEQIDLQEKPSGKFVNNTGKNNSVVTFYDDMAKRTGLDIYLDYDISDKLGEKAKGVKGIEGVSRLASGKILVDAKSSNVLSTLHHEVAEQIKNIVPEQFAPLEKFMTTKGYKTIGANAFSDVIENYRKAYPNSNDTELRKEYVCDMFGTLMTSPEALQQFYDSIDSSNVSEEEKKSIKAQVKEIIDKIITALNNYMEKHGIKANTEFVLDESTEGTKEIKTTEDAINYALQLYSELKNTIDNTTVNESSANDVQYSKKIESEYEQAVADNDMDKAAELVKDYAASKGYTEQVYHGTQYHFGFTQIDLEKSDDKQTFWATSSLGTAQTYSGKNFIARIRSNGKNVDLSKVSNNGLKNLLQAYLNTHFSNYEHKITIKNQKSKNPTYIAESKKYGSKWTYSKEDIIKTLEQDRIRYISGNYEFYANTNNFMTVDAEGKNWNNISYKMDNLSINDLKRNLRLYYDGFDGWVAPSEVTYNEKNKTFDLFFSDGGDWDNTTLTLEEAREFFKDNKYSVKTRTIASSAMKKGFDGVLIKNVVDNGGRGNWNYKGADDVYIFFNPTEQVKSADPVTYDDNGEVVPLEKRFDKDYNDIRYALSQEEQYAKIELTPEEQEISKLTKETANYKHIIGELNKLIKGTQTHRVGSEHVHKISQFLKGEIPSKITYKELDPILDNVFTTAYNHNNNIENPEVIRAAENAIRSMLDYAPITEESKGLLKQIRMTPFSLSKEQKSELASKYGSYKEWKNKHRDIVINQNAPRIDQVWEGEWLSDNNPYRYLFEAKGELNDKDMLIALTELVDDAKASNGIEEQMLMSKEDIVNQYALELLSRYSDAPLLADELWELRQERKTAYKDAKRQGRAEGRTEQREKNRVEAEKKKSAKLEKEVSETWDKILKQVTDPTYLDKGHLTKGWAEAVANFSEIINFNAKNPGEYQRTRMNNAELKYRQAIKDNAPESTIQLYKQEWDRWTNLYERFNEQAEKKAKALSEILNTENEYAVENEVLKQRLDEFASGLVREDANGNIVATPYYRLSNEQKQELLTIGKMILKENEYQNRIRGKYKFLAPNGDVQDDVKNLVERAVNESKDSKAKGKNFLRTFTNSILTPEAVFDALGGYHKGNVMHQLWQMVEDAQEDQWDYEKETLSILDPVLKATDKAKRLRAEQEQRYDSKHLMDIGVKGVDANDNEVDVKLPRGMVLELLTHISKPQNLLHISEGGLTVPNFKGYYNGDYTKAYDSGQVLIRGISSDISNLNKRINDALEKGNYELADKLQDDKYELQQWKIDEWLNLYEDLKSQLTEYELQVLDTMEKVYQKSGELMGKVSDAMYGVNLFDEINGVADYYPISVDKAYLGSEIEYGAGAEANLGASGFAQKRVNSKKPLLLGDIFVTTANHLNKTAKYYAYLIPQHNMNAVLNGQFEGFDNNLRKTLERKDATKLNYIENWKRDMFGGQSADKGLLGEDASKKMAWLRSNYAAATLNLNAKVALYQPLSYFMALTSGGAKNTVKGLFNGRQKATRAMIDEATNMLWARDYKGGMVETETLKQGNSKLSRAMKWLDRLTGGHLDWIHNRDISTVTRLGGVAKAILEEEGLTPDTEQWNKEFARVYKDLMKTGQPLADTVYRPEIQRSRNEMVKFIAMFYTVRLQMINTAAHEVQQYRTYKQDLKNGNYGVTQADVKEQKGRAVRSIVALCLSQASVVAVQMLITSLLYHTIWDIGDEDKDVTPESITKGFTKSYAKTMVEMIPVAGELYEIIDFAIDKIQGNSTYGKEYEGLSLNGLDQLTDMVNKAINSASNIVNGKYTVKDLDGNLQDIFKIFGIPYGNVSKLFKGVAGTIQDNIDNGEYDFSDLQSDTNKFSLYAKGKLSEEEMKDLLTEDNKTKLSNALEKAYLAGEIDGAKAYQKLMDSGLYHSKTQSTSSYLKGKVEKWDIKKHKDDYVDSLSNGNETQESRDIIREIANLPYSNAFPSGTKSSYEKLLTYIRKWKKGA